LEACLRQQQRIRALRERCVRGCAAFQAPWA
jgi:hypothetical protein